MSKVYYRKQFSNYLGEQRAIDDIVQSFEPDPNVSPTPSPTPSITPSITPTKTPSPTPTPSISPSQTATPTITPTSTLTPTPTITPTNTRTQTPTPTITRTSTLTPTPTITPSATPAPAPPLNANIALWYDASDPSTITTQVFSGVTRVTNFISKGYNLLNLTNDYLTYPLQAPRYIPSFNFVGKNAIIFSADTIATLNRPRLLNNSGTTANLVMPNGSTYIYFAKVKYNGSTPYVPVVDFKTISSLAAGIVHENISYGTNTYGSGPTGIANNLSSPGSGGFAAWNVRQALSAYTNFGLYVTKLDSPNTKLAYSWVNKTQLEKSFSAYGLLETTGQTINYMALGGRNSQIAPQYFQASEPQDSEFYEVLVYDKVLTDIELDDVYNYFDAKYGYNSLFDSSNFNTHDLKIENWTEYGVTGGTSINNYYSIGAIIPGQLNNSIANFTNVQNSLYYSKNQSTFDGVNKAYVNKNNIGPYTDRCAATHYGGSGQTSFLQSGVRPLTYFNDGSGVQVASGCSYTDSSTSLLPNVNYTLTGTTQDVCGYNSATTWNVFIEYNSNSSNARFNITSYYSASTINSFFEGIGTSGTTLIASGKPDISQVVITNNPLTTDTGKTVTYEIWVCDSVGNDTELLTSYSSTLQTNIFPNFQPFAYTTGLTSNVTLYSLNHFKIKYTVI